MKPTDAAFARPFSLEEGKIGNLTHDAQPGLTARAYIAAQALPGILAAHPGPTPLPSPEEAADLAVDYADALLARLGRP